MPAGRSRGRGAQFTPGKTHRRCAHARNRYISPLASEPLQASLRRIMSQKRRILIVDDDGDLRMALAEQLSLHPEFAVGEAEDVAGARTAVSSQNPDLVIMDIGLPDMDG